jgi:hypothetical protein
MPRFNPEGCPTSLLDRIPSPGTFRGGLRTPTGGQGAPAGLSQTGGVKTVDKVLQLAGPLSQYGRSPDLSHYEQLFRVEPNESWFSTARSPSNPTQFEIGSITAEAGNVIFVFDYSVRPFGFSGVAADDVQPFPEGQLSGSFGYVLRLGGRAPGIVNYRLDPVSPTLQRTAFRNGKPTLPDLAQLSSDEYARARSQSFASAAGYGGEVHPQQPGRFGAQNVPFMMTIEEGNVLSIVGVVFNRIPSPVSFVEARVSGYIASASLAKKLIRDLELATQ